MEQETLFIKTRAEKYADAISRLRARGIDVFEADKGIKNTETDTKYDPCRKFRKGDIVEPRELYGRIHKALFYNDKYEVLEDEDKDGIVKVKYLDGGFTCTSYIPFYWLKLITPVEELEPYSVKEYKWYWHVLGEWNGEKMTVCKFIKDFHPHAKEAAEAECARLNAEHRKEQE